MPARRAVQHGDVVRIEQLEVNMDLIVDAQNALGECLLWCDRTQRLWWTDILGRKLWRHRPADGSTVQWDMPERLASFALTGNEARLLLGLESRLAWFDARSGEVLTIVEVEPDVEGTRVNDGRCDRQGRFVFGTMNEAVGRAPIGHFYRLGHGLQLERLPLAPVAIANSICFSTDGATMYFCDSLSGEIRCCDYGDEVGNERVFTVLPPGGGEPDGSVVDADGCLWNAEWGAGRIVRYRPDGSVERAIAVPVSQPTCPAFGGAGLDELYVTSALVDLLVPERYAGGVFGSRIGDAAGLPEERFGARVGDDLLTNGNFS
jgi:L-arabinonolactonase